MEKIIVEMKWENVQKRTPQQRCKLRQEVECFMNKIADLFGWDEETYSIENELSKKKDFPQIS